MSTTEVVESTKPPRQPGPVAAARTSSFPVATSAEVRRAVIAIVRRARRTMAVITLLFWLAAGAGLVGPWLLGRIVDDLTAGGSTRTIGILAGGMLFALLAQAGFTFEANRRTLRHGERVFADLREDFVDSVVRLPLSDVEAAGTGDLLTRTTEDVRTVSNAVRFGIPHISIAVITILATFLASLLTDPLLTLAMPAAAPLLVVAARWYLRRSGPAYAAVVASYSALNQVTASNADGARTTDLLALADIRARAADNAIHVTFRATLRATFLSTVLFPATNFAFSVPVMATLLWGGWLTSRGLTTAGAVATVTLYSVHLGPSVEQLIRWLDNLQLSTVSLARLLGVRHVPADRTPHDASPAGPTIDLRDVTFAYQPGQPVLHGITLTLRPGERLAIVGPSGSGKSTLARIIAGINAPQSGSATIGGVPLTSRRLDLLRREVALVTQEHHIFRGSVADNLRLGRANATERELAEALAAVGAHWTLDLPEGLDTLVGSGSLQLTPTQAQHIALARLILLDPLTLVLDEATAMLDPTAARSVERSIAATLRGRTVVAIAHRLHTAHDADRIAVVVDGRLTELGSHDELLARGGEYARLWHAWQDA